MMRLNAPAGLICAALLSFFGASAFCATEDVFRRHKDAVLRVRILERSSGAQAAVGSGFFVGSGGLAVTNFHVVAQLLWKPGSYEATVLLDGGESKRMELLSVDVVHDLALFRVADAPARTLALAVAAPPKGQRLYALGNPHDLGMTIVEGSYSGLLDDSLVQRVHLTGTLNPGMSGGPVLDGTGQVVGVSVASAGDEVSFLVPVAFVRALVERGASAASPEALRKAVASQLTAHQADVASRLSSAPFQAQGLGPFLVPGRLSSAFRCWANSQEGEDQPYEIIHSECAADDPIFINDRLATGRINFVHHMLETDRLNSFQFAALEKRYLHEHSPFGEDARMLLGAGMDAEDRDLTPYDCSASELALGELVVKAVVCLRAYRRFPGLYDLHWRGASFVDSRRAFTSSLTVEGTSRENAGEFLRRYLEAFAWKK